MTIQLEARLLSDGRCVHLSSVRTSKGSYAFLCWEGIRRFTRFVVDEPNPVRHSAYPLARDRIRHGDDTVLGRGATNCSLQI